MAKVIVGYSANGLRFGRALRRELARRQGDPRAIKGRFYVKGRSVFAV
jgi:hypothetical protein